MAAEDWGLGNAPEPDGPQKPHQLQRLKTTTASRNAQRLFHAPAPMQCHAPGKTPNQHLHPVCDQWRDPQVLQVGVLARENAFKRPRRRYEPFLAPGRITVYHWSPVYPLNIDRKQQQNPPPQPVGITPSPMLSHSKRARKHKREDDIKGLPIDRHFWGTPKIRFE